MRFSDLIKQPLIENINICEYIKDAIPPKIGAVPIPKNHIRLLHQTQNYNVQSICSLGLLTKWSKVYFNEDQQPYIWASNVLNDEGYLGTFDTKHTVEFSIDRNDSSIKYISDHKTRYRNLPQDLNFETCQIGRDILPNEIISIHMPWHHIARDILRKYKKSDFRYPETMRSQIENMAWSLNYPDKEYLIDYIIRQFSNKN